MRCDRLKAHTDIWKENHYVSPTQLLTSGQKGDIKGLKVKITYCEKSLYYNVQVWQHFQQKETKEKALEQMGCFICGGLSSH